MYAAAGFNAAECCHLDVHCFCLVHTARHKILQLTDCCSQLLYCTVVKLSLHQTAVHSAEPCHNDIVLGLPNLADFGTQIWLEPKPDLAGTCFLVTEQYASDKTNGINNAVSRYRGSTLQCFLCCVTVCQLLTKFVE